MIPKQFQNETFRFILIKKKEKVPEETEWQKTNNYKYNDEKLLNWIKNGGNYGIINASGNLLVIDADDAEITKTVINNLPKTFVVQTSQPGKNHIYYSCKDMTKSKLYFKNGKGDIRFSNSAFYTLCPGSIHPNGETYKIMVDIPITEITENEAMEALKEYIDEKPKKVKHTIEGVNEGERNETLFKFACKLNHDKYSYDDALILLKERNNRCKKPLSEDEILTILNSAYSYENKEEKPKEKKKTVKEILRTDKKGIELLKDKNLLYYIIQELRKDVIGNTDTILALINKICLRLVINTNPASSNVLVSDLSGAGKDYITKNLCNLLVPSSKYEHLSDVSEKLFNYWTIKEKDGGTFDGMVVHLEDITEERIKSQAFKVRASGENEIRIVDKGKVRNVIIVGKPVIIITSLKASIDIEGIRRWDKLNVDTSDEITKQVKNIFAQKMLGNKKYEHDDTIKYALHNQLQRVTVVIPYADKLCEELPDVLTMRTQMQKLFDYIKSSAALHQHQREKDKDGNIIANEFDYAYGKFCFNILQDMLGMASNTYEEEIIKVLKEAGEYGLKVTEIASKVSLSKVSLYGKTGELGYLNNMKEKGILSEYTAYDDQARKDITYWTLSNYFRTVLTRLYKDGKHVKKLTGEQQEGDKERLTTKIEMFNSVENQKVYIPESWLLTFYDLYARIRHLDIEKVE